MIDRLSAGSMATAGVVVGFFIIQGWAGRNIRQPQYFGETPPANSPENYDDALAFEEYNAGTNAGSGKRTSKGGTVPYDVKTGTCPVGYQKEYVTYGGDITVPVCREILQG